MLNADLLESIVETRYLTADNYMVYRTILRTFYLEHQKCTTKWTVTPYYPCSGSSLCFLHVYARAAHP